MFGLQFGDFELYFSQFVISGCNYKFTNMQREMIARGERSTYVFTS